MIDALQAATIMKTFTAYTALLLVSTDPVKAGFGGGHSNSVRKQDPYGNYAFSYDIANGHAARNGRTEHGGRHGVVGSYYIRDIDGRHRTVHYIADKAGFRAQIHTNEPGTKTSYAAAAAYSSANGKTASAGGFHGFDHFVGHGPTGYGHGQGHEGYGHTISYGTHEVGGPIYSAHGGIEHGLAAYGHSISHTHHGFSMEDFMDIYTGRT
ncbi:adult-specific rigid cuticular protein 15.7-like [Tropilaelaps mercedesae]|uniref:Adult-specific rigid cuticular protein 15.7-like n=1 Tax=Tropilaelaps mercedesae TaxID=418985 RepID=A0A1V9Y1Z0_9ACAR|nr:adult-specific rigid cuticular protein 15.7-like [Tropilaelaps mercedesae]